MNKAEIVRLSDALLSDLESLTTPLDLIFAKAFRLAEATNNEEAMTWIGYELQGYDTSTEVGRKYSLLTHRWDGKSDKGYFQGATDLAQKVEAMTHTLQAHKEFMPSGDYASVQQIEKAKRVNE
jgi:hypothetical protein